MKIKTEKVIDSLEFDKLVKETYGKPYKFQQQNGCKERQRVRVKVPDIAVDYTNDSLPEVVNHSNMGVSFKSWIERDPKQKLQSDKEYDDFHNKLWWYRNFYPDVQMILNDLHDRGLLEAGEYVIDIDW